MENQKIKRIAIIILLLLCSTVFAAPHTQRVRACDDDLPAGGELIVRGELPLGTILINRRDCNEPNYLRCVEYELVATRDCEVTLEAFDGELSSKPLDVVFEPDCWTFAPGDADGDGSVTPADARMLVNAWSPKPYNRCVDFDHDGIISPSDAVILVNHWKPE